MGLKNNSVQLNFIKRMKEMVPPNYSLVDEMAELLSLSNDSAYRRIRGETALSVDEMAILCNHYKIAFDSFSHHHSGTVTFNYKSLQNDEKSLEHYLSGIFEDLKKIKTFEKKEIIFAAEDIPVFHYFNFRELTTFKLFYWNKSSLHLSSLEGKKFNLPDISKDLLDLSRQIFDLYCQIPSVEIWTEETISSVIKQIEFHWESGFFVEKQDALLICNQLLQMIELIQKQTEKSSKFISDKGIKNVETENNFKLYQSEVMIGTNCVLVSKGDMLSTYLSYNTLYSMTTTNADFCKETQIWLKNLIKKSILLSGVSEKQRHQFFSKMIDSVDKLKEKIN